MRRKARQASKPENRPRFWGRHAVAAALANPERSVAKIWVTREAAPDFDIDPSIPVTYADATDLGRLIPRDAPHQGIVAEVDRLPDLWLGDLLERTGGTDAAGARSGYRSAQCRRDPALRGCVRRARHRHPGPARAAGIGSTRQGGQRRAGDNSLGSRVVNLSRALDEIAEAGFWQVGLTGEAGMTIAEALGPPRVALVLGAEGDGMRQNTETHCDALARLPISERMESLNVSNAAAIALYAAVTAAR